MAVTRVIVFSVISIFAGLGCSSDKDPGEGICSGVDYTQYLAFQFFVSGSTEPMGDYQGLNPFVSLAKMEDFFSTVHSKIGTSAVKCRRPAIVIGPVALDYSNADITKLIDQSFALAKQYDIAVGFHIDDGMFWATRTDLWKNPENIEWLDWRGTPNTSRYVDWVPLRLAPMMCVNAHDVRVAVRNFMSNIALSIKSNLDQLTADKKEYLYAGTIVGWEPSLDTDRDSKMPSGYHALANKGFGLTHLPGDIDQERVKILREYIEFMARPLVEAGLPVSKTYTHIAFISRKDYDYAASVNPDFAKKSYSEVNNFSPPEVAMGKNYTPGFSTYPQEGVLNEIHKLLNNSAWASSEGTNLIPGLPPMASGYGMESYLARHYNYGCRQVTIFAFHLGGDPFTDALNYASEGPDAIAAYRKFLSGATLKE